MGAWGDGPFDNDDALDFVGDLADSSRPLDQGVAEALALPESGYLESADGSIAIAAAALVACANGLEPGHPSVADLLASRPLAVTEPLRRRANAALDRVAGPESEWRELWEEAGELPAALTQLDNLRRGLQG